MPTSINHDVNAYIRYFLLSLCQKIYKIMAQKQQLNHKVSKYLAASCLTNRKNRGRSAEET